MRGENEAYASLLCGHLRLMERRLRQIPADKFDYALTPPAPTPRILAVHAWQWLICDRYHISEPDAAKHSRVPEPPTDQAALCDAFAAETQEWHTLLLSLTPEQLDTVRHQFNRPDAEMTVRGFVCHMIQHCVYKSGELATIYFALGLDGDAPFTAPFPNPIYEELFG